MNHLVLVTSETFGTEPCDFWQGENRELFMSSEQLGRALGYAEPRKSISNLVKRHEYLEEPEFSGVTVLMTGGGRQETRVFSEDGIYEVTMLAKTAKALEFRTWVRKILKSLRKKDVILAPPTFSDAKQLRAQAMLLNAKTKQTKIITDMAIRFQDLLSPESVQSLLAGVSAYLFGSPLLPMPEIEKTYTASQIADDAGVSRFLIGKLAHMHGLKQREFGLWVLSTIPAQWKQLPYFRYNEKGKTKLLELVQREGAVKP
jgi:prophage antirepressor-like protein